VAVFKDKSGAWRWVAVHSNKFYDREREVFPEAAHIAYSEWVQRTKMYPALRLFHVPVDIGVADFIDYADGFMLSSGTFKDGMEDAAKRLAGMKDLACSHGFHYPVEDFQDGVYHSYRTFEISILPAESASNRLTAVFAEEEVPMGLSGKQREFLSNVLTDETLERVEGSLKNLADEAGREGLSYKDIAARLVTEHQEEPMSEEQKTDTEDEDAGANTDADGDADADGAADGDAGVAAGADGDADAENTGDADEDEDAEVNPIVAAVGKAISDAVAPLNERLGAMEAANKALAGEIEGLKASKDAEMADSIRPRTGQPNGQPASAADGNVAPAALVEQMKAAAAAGKSAPPGAQPLNSDEAAAPYLEQIRSMYGGSRS